MKKIFTIVTLAIAGACAVSAPALAQVVGATTTTDISIVESTQIAMGWSVKKSLLGKTIYNKVGQKVGKVEDIIISPDKSVSYVIVGAGGFIGIGRHDVAIPVMQIQDQAGKLVMSGATKDMIKSMARFDYVNDHAQRDRFILATEQDIGKAKSRLSELEARAGAAAIDEKARIDLEITALQVDMKSAEAKLIELKQAATTRWKEFKPGVTAATVRLRQSVKAAKG